MKILLCLIYFFSSFINAMFMLQIEEKTHNDIIELFLFINTKKDHQNYEKVTRRFYGICYSTNRINANNMDIKELNERSDLEQKNIIIEFINKKIALINEEISIEKEIIHEFLGPKETELKLICSIDQLKNYIKLKENITNDLKEKNISPDYVCGFYAVVFYWHIVNSDNINSFALEEYPLASKKFKKAFSRFPDIGALPFDLANFSQLSHCRFDDFSLCKYEMINILNNNKPVIILINGQMYGMKNAHYMLLIGYYPDSDLAVLFDPSNGPLLSVAKWDEIKENMDIKTPFCQYLLDLKPIGVLTTMILSPLSIFSSNYLDTINDVLETSFNDKYYAGRFNILK